MADFSVFIDSGNTSSERRISPAWTVGTLKQKLWPITGIPPASQALSIPSSSDDDLISSFDLQALSVLVVSDTRPKSQRENYTDDSKVTKFELSQEEYEARNDSVLAYKKRNQIGRFDPNAVDREQELAARELQEIREGNIAVGKRCRIVGVSDRRGTVRYVGEVPETSKPGYWVGIEYDEPVGKNDGSLNGTRYFETRPNHGSFLKTNKVEIGDFPPALDDDLLESDDEI